MGVLRGLFPAIALAWLGGCERSFDHPFLPGSGDYAGPAWSRDDDGNGIADSLEKYAPGCQEGPRACLEMALANARNAGGGIGLDSVEAEDLELSEGEIPVAPTIRWFPQAAAGVSYTLHSDDARVAWIQDDSLLVPISAGSTTVTVTAWAPAGLPRTARFHVTVRPARLPVRGVKVQDMEFVLLRRGEKPRKLPVIAWDPPEATDKSYTMKSDHTHIARIAGDTVVVAGLGETEISLTTGDGGFTERFKVKVCLSDGILGRLECE